MVPLLTIHLDVKPAPAEGVVAQRVGDLSIAGDLNLGTIAMETGAILTGQVVRMDNGTGVEDADTDVDACPPFRRMAFLRNDGIIADPYPTSSRSRMARTNG